MVDIDGLHARTHTKCAETPAKQQPVNFNTLTFFSFHARCVLTPPIPYLSSRDKIHVQFPSRSVFIESGLLLDTRCNDNESRTCQTFLTSLGHTIFFILKVDIETPVGARVS